MAPLLPQCLFFCDKQCNIESPNNNNTCTHGCAVALLEHKASSILPKWTSSWMARPGTCVTTLQNKFQQGFIFLSTPSHMHCTRGRPDEFTPCIRVTLSSPLGAPSGGPSSECKLGFLKICSGCFANFLKSYCSC